MKKFLLLISLIVFSVSSFAQAIIGASTVCIGAAITLSNATTGGSWTSSNTTIATIGSATGVVTGVDTGTVIITYNVSAGFVTASVTVNPNPASITGVTTFCYNATTTLSDATAGGTWSSSSTSIATTTGGTIGVIYGTGVGIGPAVITYSLPTGCIATTIVTSSPPPAPITSLFSVCVGLTTTLTDQVSGGAWSSGNMAAATVDAGGVVYGVSPGVSVITYSISSCSTTTSVTVDPLPAPITGPASVCVNSAVTMSDASTPGSWSLSNTSAATIDATGDVTGLSGFALDTITYKLTTGCIITTTIAVNPLPGPILGNRTICAGFTSQLSDASAPGSWTSSVPGVAGISATGLVTATTAGPGSPGGITVITFTAQPSGCIASGTLTVNALPMSITGNTTICAGTSSTLGDGTPLGTWSSSNTNVATIDATGKLWGDPVLVQSNAVVTYSLTTGCTATANVVVNPLPLPITGNTNICPGTTTTLNDATSTGAWSTSVPLVATVTAVAGVATVTGGTVTGTTTITYTLPSSCFIATTVTVNPLPAPITGPDSVCAGSAISLTDATPGGNWSSSDGVSAPVANTGVINANPPGGSAVITYSLTTGCIATTTIMVNPLPAPITGITSICAGSTTVLSDATPLGTWSSSNGSVAFISAGPGPGNVLGGTSANPGGTTIITYTLPTACYTTTVLTVSPLPAAITGNSTICSGLTTQLSDVTAGGTWSSATVSAATVDALTGLVTGSPIISPATAQTSVITYSLTTGCTTALTVTVDPLPGIIQGNGTICAGLTTQLSDVVSGVWTSSNPAVASVTAGPGFTTIVTGGNVGSQSTATITLTVGTGCIETMVVTVNPLPLQILGNTVICSGLATQLTDNTPGGVWSSSSNTIASVGSVTGLVTGGNIISPAAAQIATITYSLTATGCVMTTTVAVNPLPQVITGPSSVCQGSTINLNDVTASGTWSSSNTNLGVIVPVGPFGSFTADTAGGVTGVDTIIYTLGTGCLQTKTVTVNSQPYPITGVPLQLCNHASAFLSDAQGGGIWTSSNTAVAIVGSLNGLVTGSQPGSGPLGGQTVTITYSIGGCSVITIVGVNPQPVAITGPANICSGASITLNDATIGGVWSSSNNTIATVQPSVGGEIVVGGANPGGLDTITYAIGSCFSTATVMVNVQPSPILGTASFCNLTSTVLSDAVGGGVWSSNNTGVATVDSLTGIVTGVMPTSPAVTGNATITYTETAGGCFISRVVTVKIQPVAINGFTQVCNGLTTQLSDGTPGGIWSVESATASSASVSGTGLVTGLSAGPLGTDGFANIDYFIGTCGVTTTVTVHPLPSTITGTFFVCKGSTTTLADLSPSGAWSSSLPDTATAGLSTGVITGISTGTTMITYTLPTTCITTHTLTVVNVPDPITGSDPVCAGLTEQLTDATGGGVWTLSNTNTATIGSSSGIVTGIASGTVIISYTLGSGCNVVAPLVVNPLSPVIGVATVCIGLTINLSDTTVGGVWTSSNANATVDAVTGIVTGVVAGTAVIAYTLPTTCQATISVTILPLPAVISGPDSVCDGLSITLSDTSPGGVWSSSNSAVASIDPVTGVLTAGPSGIPIPTPVVITDFAIGCPRADTIIVNPLPGAIIGNTSICMGLTSVLSDATGGGTWSSDNSAVAAIGSLSGVVTANAVGTANVTYSLGTGCVMATVVTVNALPSIIAGDTVVCVGSTTQLTDSVGGGVWLSSDPTIAGIDFITGLVTGVDSGRVVITNQNISGCVMSITVTVNPLPTAIAGPNNVCIGSSATLTSGTGGTWSSTNQGVATIDSMAGVVTGIIPGTATISYTIATGCSATLFMTVNPVPAPISGITAVCAGNYTQLLDATGSGAWSSSNPSVATVDASGVVWGAGSSGTSIIDYTLATGCFTSTVVTIAAPPTAISAASADVCIGSQLIVTDGTPGGTWTSSNTFVATISLPGTGVADTVNGVSAGFAVITYTMGGGTCYATYIITVDPLPLPITGIQAVCAGLTTQLFDATTPGSWSSATPGLATVDASTGVVSGITAGPAIISYAIPTTCAVTATVTVNPLPDSITGNKMVCLNGTRTLSDASQPGTWSVSNSAAAISPGPGVGIVYGNYLGVDTVTFTITATGCIMTTTVSVQPLPLAFNVTIDSGGAYCAGHGGVDIHIDSSQTGVEYYLYLGSTPTGTFAGTGHPMDLGPQIPAGTYTVVGDNTFTTCSINMTGSVTVVITPTVIPTVDISANPGDAVCAGTAVAFTSIITNGGSGPSYQWSVNGVNLSTGSSYTFTPANNDLVKVIMTSNEHCAFPKTVTDALTMDVITPVLPSVSIMESPGDTVCIGTGVTFTAIPTAGGPSPSYQWTVNSGLVGTGPVYSYVPSNGDIIYVTMVSNYLCRLANTAQSGNVLLDVQIPVIPGVTITASPGLLIYQGESDTLTANVTNGVYPVYQWYIDGLPIPGATNATFVSDILTTPKDDSIGCLVTNRGACNESSFGWVYIESHPLGVTQVSANLSDLGVVPNPNKGAFTLKGTLGKLNDEEVSIELTDVLGQVVYKDKILAKGGVVNDNITLNSTLANGMYMLNVRSASGNKVFHIVIEQ